MLCQWARVTNYPSVQMTLKIHLAALYLLFLSCQLSSLVVFTSINNLCFVTQNHLMKGKRSFVCILSHQHTKSHLYWYLKSQYHQPQQHANQDNVISNSYHPPQHAKHLIYLDIQYFFSPQKEEEECIIIKGIKSDLYDMNINCWDKLGIRSLLLQIISLWMILGTGVGSTYATSNMLTKLAILFSTKLKYTIANIMFLKNFMIGFLIYMTYRLVFLITGFPIQSLKLV